MAVAVLEVQQGGQMPVEVVGEIGDLLPQPVLRVAGQASARACSGKGLPGSSSSSALGSPKLRIA
jgi:hypothetical protein